MEYKNRIFDLIEKINTSELFNVIKNFLNSPVRKKKLAIVSFIVIFSSCCFYSILTRGNDKKVSLTLTEAISKVTETKFSSATVFKTKEAEIVYAELDEAKEKTEENTKIIEKNQTKTPEATKTEKSSFTDFANQENGKLFVTFIDVGQGDSVLIKSPEGSYALIDGGEQDSIVANYLKQNNIDNIELIIATHPNSDHIGGLIDVIKQFKPKRIITNGDMHTTITYESFLDAILISQAEYIEVGRGDMIELDSIKFDVLHPDNLVEGDLNRNSLVLSLTYYGTKFLFTGDATTDSELELLRASLPLRSNILKVGHHGSARSSSIEFINAVKPEVSIYSAGKGNSYGHPAKETILRLLDVGSDVYGTDINGTITIEVNKTGYKIFPSIKENVASFYVVDEYIIDEVDPKEETPQLLSISVVSLTSPVKPGANATLRIQTAPGADCSITVNYKSGPSQAAGLGAQIANSSGLVTWSWKVGTRTSPGVWNIVVVARHSGKTETLSIPFEVKK